MKLQQKSVAMVRRVSVVSPSLPLSLAISIAAHRFFFVHKNTIKYLHTKCAHIFIERNEYFGPSIEPCFVQRAVAFANYSTMRRPYVMSFSFYKHICVDVSSIHHCVHRKKWFKLNITQKIMKEKTTTYTQIDRILRYQRQRQRWRQRQRQRQRQKIKKVKRNRKKLTKKRRSQAENLVADSSFHTHTHHTHMILPSFERISPYFFLLRLK